jgi:hypothetical protein
MKKALLGTALATGMMLTTSSVMAVGYIGVDYQMFRMVAEGWSDSQPEGAALRLGGSLNDNFMVEGRIGASTAGDKTDGVSFKVDDYMGVYVKGGFDLADMIFPYVAVGFSKVDLVLEDEKETEGDFSYGLGADLHFGSFQVGAEWMMMLDETDYELKTGTVSFAWRF